MMTAAEHALQRDNRVAFLVAWTQASLTQLQHDVYMGLQRHLGNSILVSPIFTNVTTENEECATYLWDALLQAFHPRSPQVVADFLAEKTVAILRGPDHNAADPSLAFRKWDTAVGALNRHAHDLPPITAQMLCACLMYASLHASKEDSYYQAYMQLQATLALPTAIFDAATVRAAAVSAFHAEQRRLSSTSRAPESVLGFAAAATGFCLMVRFAPFALLSRPISLPCLTVDPSPTSPIRPSAPTRPTRLCSRTPTLRLWTSNALLGLSRTNAKTIAIVLGTIACKRRRMPSWQSLPPANTTLMSEALVSRPLAHWFVSIS